MCIVQPIAVGENAVPFAFRASRRLRRGFQIVFPVGDRRDQLLQHHFVIFDQPFGELFQQRDLVSIIEQGKVRLHSQRSVFTFDDIQAQGVEGGDHQPARLFAPQRLPDALFHFARGLVGEGDGRDMARLITAAADQVGDFIRNNAGLTGTGARQHQARSGNEFDGLLLARV